MPADRSLRHKPENDEAIERFANSLLPGFPSSSPHPLLNNAQGLIIAFADRFGCCFQRPIDSRGVSGKIVL